ncbi:hypothetical protein AGMMS50262_12600 [Bacteroidia bacterium]|nr:hypothetical protein AGMMS50262_12600 [Bacteroidia bacterium]
MANFRANSFPPITQYLLIINLAVWGLCSLFPNLVSIIGLHYFQAHGFYLYQLFTYMFTHEAFTHLFFNMFALFMFGGLVEQAMGPKRYLTYYLLTGLGAGIIQMLVFYFRLHWIANNAGYDLQELYNYVPVMIGASGAVFGLLLAFGMLFPNMPMYFMFIPVPIKAKYLVIGYGVIEFFFGIANRSGDNVGHFAHLGGMLVGLIIMLYWKKGGNGNFFRNIGNTISGWFTKKQDFSKSTYRRSETDYEYNQRKHDENEEIDRILDKIKQSGYNSLSENEKKTLFNARR